MGWDGMGDGMGDGLGWVRDGMGEGLSTIQFKAAGGG
jgi:hypothetical protein